MISKTVEKQPYLHSSPLMAHALSVMQRQQLHHLIPDMGNWFVLNFEVTNLKKLQDTDINVTTSPSVI